MLDKRQDRPFDDVILGAIRLNMHQKAFPVDGRDLASTGCQRVEHLLNIAQQVWIVDQFGDDMPDGPADVAWDQMDDIGGGGREPENVEPVIDKHGGDAAAGQQIIHVVIGAGQLGDLVLQLGVHRDQLLVDRLQLFLGGFQLLIGGLQLLVNGLHFLVGGFQFLVGRL